MKVLISFHTTLLISLLSSNHAKLELISFKSGYYTLMLRFCFSLLSFLFFFSQVRRVYLAVIAFCTRTRMHESGQPLVAVAKHQMWRTMEWRLNADNMRSHWYLHEEQTISGADTTIDSMFYQRIFVAIYFCF